MLAIAPRTTIAPDRTLAWEETPCPLCGREEASPLTEAVEDHQDEGAWCCHGSDSRCPDGILGQNPDNGSSQWASASASHAWRKIVDSFGHREASVFADEDGEIVPLQELHRDERRAPFAGMGRPEKPPFSSGATPSLLASSSTGRLIA